MNRPERISPRPEREGANMKAYLLTTGIAFGLIVIAHVWRVIAESASLASDPGFIVLTLVAAGMCGWAFYLVRSSTRAK